VVAEPVVCNANSKNRRSHNTAEPINCISKVLHVLEPPEDTALYNNIQRFVLFGQRPSRQCGCDFSSSGSLAMFAAIRQRFIFCEQLDCRAASPLGFCPLLPCEIYKMAPTST